MYAAHILIVEDDNVLNDQLAELLRSKGFVIDQCHDGEQGLLSALKKKFDLILLDVLLPSLNGFSVLKTLRKTCQTPVMMITACGAEQERIEGYTEGADDYLPKPFNLMELMLRIDVLLRRTYKFNAKSNQQRVLQLDGLSLDRIHQGIAYHEQPIILTPIQFRLLWRLAESQNQVLSKAYLYQTVLDKSFSQYDRTLDMHISRVRKKLVEAGMPIERLVTVHGKGYCFS
ncbi:response regulator transcription factor [Paraglaciecola psychrophila]|jgi:two-component system response regulator PfeR|uniref:Two component transcriptional regulator, winged helix family n=1 Tax=Paraglaciecola psychrophila 170 TaxID=1129794 RepID=K6ZVG0_9ALTE|nr:response regulator transcription factor [Paraglaciecola psychrophila]AGH46810.1 two component transcriptional regulator, winged helix family [Paraglaciecola psychrophila 170]GAC39861.1 transcriptional regulatory protein CpxR [Paraglaciecola psychrophila 170]